jgi:hypothetical protein
VRNAATTWTSPPRPATRSTSMDSDHDRRWTKYGARSSNATYPGPGIPASAPPSDVLVIAAASRAHPSDRSPRQSNRGGDRYAMAAPSPVQTGTKPMPARPPTPPPRKLAFGGTSLIHCARVAGSNNWKPHKRAPPLPGQVQRSIYPAAG